MQQQSCDFYSMTCVHVCWSNFRIWNLHITLSLKQIAYAIAFFFFYTLFLYAQKLICVTYLQVNVNKTLISLAHFFVIQSHLSPNIILPVLSLVLILPSGKGPDQVFGSQWSWSDQLRRLPPRNLCSHQWRWVSLYGNSANVHVYVHHWAFFWPHWDRSS